MLNLFRLSDDKWARIESSLSYNQPGARYVGNRRVIFGTTYVLKTSYRWCDFPAEYVSRRRFWADLVKTLAASGAAIKSSIINPTPGSVCYTRSVAPAI